MYLVFFDDKNGIRTARVFENLKFAKRFANLLKVHEIETKIVKSE